MPLRYSISIHLPEYFCKLPPPLAEKSTATKSNREDQKPPNFQTPNPLPRKGCTPKPHQPSPIPPHSTPGPRLCRSRCLDRSNGSSPQWSRPIDVWWCHSSKLLREYRTHHHSPGRKSSTLTVTPLKSRKPHEKNMNNMFTCLGLVLKTPNKFKKGVHLR